jgi:hypothetical protein
MMVVSKSRQRNIILTVRDILRCNLAELAEVANFETALTNGHTTSPIKDSMETPEENLVNNALSSDIGDNPVRISDVLPCSPMQQSLLLGQFRSKGHYECSFIFKLSFRFQIRQHVLEKAWQQVIDLHSILRTISIESQARPGSMDQVVLSHHEVDITFLNFHNIPVNALMVLDGHKAVFKDGKPPHYLVICQTKGNQLFVKSNLSHLLFAGQSIEILVDHFRVALTQKLHNAHKSQYSDYVRFLKQQDDT